MVLELKKLKTLFKALTYLARKGYHALDWDGILYSEIRTAYNSHQIQQNYHISFDDLLSKYDIKASSEDVNIPVKWELGSISDLETRFICTISMGTKAEKIFEIGTFLGRTTVNLAYNTVKNAKIYTLDLPQENCDFLIGKHIKEHKEIANKVIQLFGDSKKFDFSPYYNQIDLMFIDGAHSYANVLNDGLKAIKCVKSGGFILWHDFDYRHLGSSKAIIEVCKKNKLDLNRISVTPLAIAKKR